MRADSFVSRNHFDQRAQLVQQLQGEVGVIPDERKLFPKWPWNRHPNMDEVNDRIDEWLTTLPFDERLKQAHRTKGNYILATAAWYPSTTPDKLFVLTKFLYWFFLWDDEIDTGGSLADDKAATLAFCEETKTCIKRHLGTSDPHSSDIHHTLSCRPLVLMLEPILEEFRAGMAESGRQRLHADLIQFIDVTAHQQRVRTGPVLPTAEAVLRARAINIGARPCITLIEYAEDFEISEEIIRSDPMQDIITLSAELILLGNELVSFPKEARDGQIENVIFLLAFQKHLGLQESINAVYQMMVDRYQRFTDLAQAYENHPEGAAISLYLTVAKSLVTGSTSWSYDCGRYFKYEDIDEDGGVKAMVKFPEFPVVQKEKRDNKKSWVLGAVEKLRNIWSPKLSASHRRVSSTAL